MNDDTAPMGEAGGYSAEEIAHRWWMVVAQEEDAEEDGAMELQQTIKVFGTKFQPKFIDKEGQRNLSRELLCFIANKLMNQERFPLHNYLLKSSP